MNQPPNYDHQRNRNTTQMMRRSSDPEVRRNAGTATTIESLDETAARDAVTVTHDGVQQIVASPSPNAQAAKSMQSSTNSVTDDRDLPVNVKDGMELMPLNGGGLIPNGGGVGGEHKLSESMVSLPQNRVSDVPKINQMHRVFTAFSVVVSVCVIKAHFVHSPTDCNCKCLFPKHQSLALFWFGSILVIKCVID